MGGRGTAGWGVGLLIDEESTCSLQVSSLFPLVFGSLLNIPPEMVASQTGTRRTDNTLCPRQNTFESLHWYWISTGSL